MQKLVLVRHGQSQWNLENRFTGWVDSPLTEKGEAEAKAAGERIAQSGLQFDLAYTSYLQRAIRTLWFILEKANQTWIPVEKHWRLNERHYGGLQGLNKQETRDKYGDDQVFQWRRSYATLPPDATGPFQEEQLKDRRYKNIPRDQFPKGEALKQTLERVQPYWEAEMLPHFKKAGDMLVVAHGNSLRALVKLLAGMDEDEITQFEFATGVPLVCDMTEDYKIKSMDWME
ncbi:MAG: 2,3-diphosphoglycerate-dependent phosphoglycerate mutase [Bdellovibrionales bacterium]|nr:2,3-diphosphoglycerate-dependent phosphoglycerate mutase [Bdellovibrionales bacterium]